MAQVNPQQLNTFSSALSELYQPIRRSGYDVLAQKYGQAETKALQDFAGRGLYGTGAVQNYIEEQINKNKALAQGQLEGNLAQSQARALSDLYSQALDQAFQEQMLERQRQYGLQDLVRNLALDVVGGFTSPLFKAYGANIGYNLAPQAYKDALQSLINKNQSGSIFAGRVTSPQQQGGLPGLTEFP